MDALDFVTRGEDAKPVHLIEFVRLRAPLVPDDYDPQAVVPDWSAEPARLTVRGFFGTGDSTIIPNEVRAQVQLEKTIVFPDPDTDVRAGDRLEQPGHANPWNVLGVPDDQQNPWTGWRPTLVVRAVEYRG